MGREGEKKRRGEEERRAPTHLLMLCDISVVGATCSTERVVVAEVVAPTTSTTPFFRPGSERRGRSRSRMRDAQTRWHRLVVRCAMGAVVPCIA